MRQWFTLLWFSVIFIFFAGIIIIISFVFDIGISSYIPISLLLTGLFLACYVMLFGLIFPLLWDLLWDLFKTARKLDKENK